MAIIKKKMAGKPAMKKSPIRKAKNGDTVAKSDTVRTEYNKDKELKEVKVRPGFLDTIKSTADQLYKEDFTKANKPGRSTAGKAWRKTLNGIAKAVYTPLYTVGAPLAGIDQAIRSGVAKRRDARAEKAKEAADAAAKSTTDSTAKKRMGGKVSKVAPKMMKKAAPKMAMKKMSKKK